MEKPTFLKEGSPLPSRNMLLLYVADDEGYSPSAKERSFHRSSGEKTEKPATTPSDAFYTIRV